MNEGLNILTEVSEIKNFDRKWLELALKIRKKNFFLLEYLYHQNPRKISGAILNIIFDLSWRFRVEKCINRGIWPKMAIWAPGC